MTFETDIFSIFEVDGKGYIETDDLKQGLKLLGLNPSDFDIKLLMKRFDLNRQGLLTYSDCFDIQMFRLLDFQFLECFFQKV